LLWIIRLEPRLIRASASTSSPRRLRRNHRRLAARRQLRPIEVLHQRAQPAAGRLQ